MKTRDIVISLIGLLISFLLMGGGFFFLLPSLHPILSSFLSTIGLGMMGVGFILLVSLYTLSRRRYLLIRMGGVSVHRQIIGLLLQEKLHELFPEKEVQCEVEIHKKGKVEVFAKIPYFLDEHERERKLHNLELVLTRTLAKEFDMEKEFIFNVSFTEELA